MNIAALSSGISLGFSAIALPQLRTFGNTTDDPNLYQPFTVTEESGSWIGKISTQQEFEKHTSLASVSIISSVGSITYRIGLWGGRTGFIA